jgi:hypothetical protein
MLHVWMDRRHKRACSFSMHLPWFVPLATRCTQMQYNIENE